MMMNKKTPVDELILRKMQVFTDCAVREGDSPFPYTPPDSASIVEVPENSIPALTAAILEASDQGHALITVSSLRSFKIACVLNESTDEGHHMAIFYNGEWDADAFLTEIRYEDSLLTDDTDNTYCIGKCLFREDVFADVDGRILLKCTEKPLQTSVPLRKKRDSSAWGALLLNPVFCEETFLGRLAEMPSDLDQRILLLYNLLIQMKLRNDDMIPVTDSILAFKGGEGLVLHWKHTLGRSFRYSDFCFSVLFGQELTSCKDITGIMLNSISCTETIPDYFLGELERVFLLGGKSSAESWEAVLMRTKIDLTGDQD